MHDLMTIVGFLTMLMAPCLVALDLGLHDGAEGYMREAAELEDMQLRHAWVPGNPLT